MAFVDLEKEFDRVPRRVIWWALRKLDVDEWLVLGIQNMYENARSRKRVGCNLSKEFSVELGVHQGSCLIPLLFITVLEALSQEFRTGCPWENLYAEDLAIITESLEELQQKLILWKTNMEGKGFRVNMGNINILIFGPRFDVLQKSGKDPCGVCLEGVGTNSIFCGVWSSWIHQECSGIPGRLKSDASCGCKRCTGQARPIYGRLMTEVTVGREKLEVVPSFCYLGDCLSSGRCGEFATIARCRVAWTNSTSFCASSPPADFPSPPEEEFTIRLSSETWAPTLSNLHRLQRNDQAMYAAWRSGKGTPHSNGTIM